MNAVKAKFPILIGAGATMFLCLALCRLKRAPWDPLYNEIPLSKHLESCSVNAYGGIGKIPFLLEGPPEPVLEDVEVASAREAILNVGTNALPMLVHMLGGGETVIDRNCRRMVETFGLPKRFLRTNAVPPSLNVRRALAAFYALGPRAAPAADDIIRLLNSADTAVEAIAALVLIRPEREDQILSLTNVARLQRRSPLGFTPENSLSIALLALGSFGPKASGAIPFLLGCHSSTNEQIKAAAAVALSRVGAQADTVVPFIVASLPVVNAPPPETSEGMARISNPQDMAILLMKIWALEQFGPKARSALPTLSNLELYPLGNIQEAAKKAKARINGEVYKPRDPKY